MGEAIISRNGSRNGNSGVGLKTSAGGEIFNDYVGNRALSRYSSTFGVKNISGCKAFSILSIDTENNTYTLDSTEGLEVGDIYSIHLFYDIETPTEGSSISNQGYKYGAITEINGNTITVDNLYYKPNEGYKFYPVGESINFMSYINEYGYDSEFNTLKIDDKPDVGTRTIGHGTLVAGYNNKATSKGAVSFGFNNFSQGSYAATFGRDNIAAYNGFVVGCRNEVTGFDGFAVGIDNIVSKEHGIALGSKHKISGGIDPIAIGRGNTVSHDVSTMIGVGLVSSTNSQVVVGRYNKYDELANYLFCVGSGSDDTNRNNAFTVYPSGTALLGSDDVPIYDNAVATKKYVDNTSSSKATSAINGRLNGSVILNKPDENVASGQISTAIGDRTNAVGPASLATGCLTDANATRSFTANIGTVANGYAQTVIGRYNKPIPENIPEAFVDNKAPLFIIGNGTSKENRSNAVVVYYDGHCEIQTMGTTDNSVATKAYVDNLIGCGTKEPSKDSPYLFYIQYEI